MAVRTETVPQGLKPSFFSSYSVRLKSCPDTKPSFRANAKSHRRLAKPVHQGLNPEFLRGRLSGFENALPRTEVRGYTLLPLPIGDDLGSCRGLGPYHSRTAVRLLLLICRPASDSAHQRGTEGSALNEFFTPGNTNGFRGWWVVWLCPSRPPAL